jgi:allantoinase
MAAPEGFTWPNGARLALSLLVNVEEGAEQNIRDGDRGPEPVDELSASPTRKMRVHGNESNYLYGIKAGAPRVLNLLDEYGMPATWTAAALALKRAPELAAILARRDDEIACHGLRWSHQYWMDEAAERAFITGARETIARLTGRRPVGWLSRYLHTEATRRILAEEGFFYHMDDYSDDFPFWDRVETGAGEMRPMVILPYAIDTNDMKMWLAPALTPAQWASYAIESFDCLRREAAGGAARMMSLGVHLRIIGRPGRIGALQAFLAHVAKHRDACWIATREQIATAFALRVPAP